MEYLWFAFVLLLREELRSVGLKSDTWYVFFITSVKHNITLMMYAFHTAILG